MPKRERDEESEVEFIDLVEIGVLEKDPAGGRPILVKLTSVDGNPPKLSLGRVVELKSGQVKRGRLGFLTLQEAKALTELLSSCNLEKQFKTAEGKLAKLRD